MTTRIESRPALDPSLAFPPPHVPPLRPDPTPLPDPDAFTVGDNLRRFIESSKNQQKAGAVASLVDVSPSADVDAVRAAKIRSFYESLNIEVPVLQGGPGETRRVAIPFRMSSLKYNDAFHAALVEALDQSASRKGAGFVIAGRPTPEQVAAVVKDLARTHPEQFGPTRSPEDVRNYLRSLGVGIDCAGSVQLALFASHGLSPEAGKEQFQLRDRLNEDLSQLDKNSRFAIVPDPSLLRPGDLVILKPPAYENVGHTVIVTEKSESTLSAAEATTLSRFFPELAQEGKAVIKIGVASSFGHEGPQERTWVYDPATKQWGDLGGQLFDDDGTGRRTPADRRHHSGPWDHPMKGMYHPR